MVGLTKEWEGDLYGYHPNKTGAQRVSDPAGGCRETTYTSAPAHTSQRAPCAVMGATGQTTPLGLATHIPGERIAGNEDNLQTDMLVQIFRRQRTEHSVQVPAVAEPLLVWILTGNARVEERAAGEAWQGKEVQAGDFYLTATDVPYEMRWQVRSPESFEVMHVYLGVSLLEDAIAQEQGRPCRIRETAGDRDEVISQLLALCRHELLSRHGTSAGFLAGLARCLWRVITWKRAPRQARAAGLSLAKSHGDNECQAGATV